MNKYFHKCLLIGDFRPIFSSRLFTHLEVVRLVDILSQYCS